MNPVPEQRWNPHLKVPEDVPTGRVPDIRWAGDAHGRTPDEVHAAAMSEGVAIGTLATLLKDVVSMPEMRHRLDLIHSQETPVQFAFGVTPPPSPRGPSTATIARYGPTEGTKGINEEAMPQPPPPKRPEITRTKKQEERFEEFQQAIEKASAQNKEKSTKRSSTMATTSGQASP